MHVFDALSQLGEPINRGKRLPHRFFLGRSRHIVGHGLSDAGHATTGVARQPLQLVVLVLFEEYLGAVEAHSWKHIPTHCTTQPSRERGLGPAFRGVLLEGEATVGVDD